MVVTNSPSDVTVIVWMDIAFLVMLVTATAERNLFQSAQPPLIRAPLTLTSEKTSEFVASIASTQGRPSTSSLFCSHRVSGEKDGLDVG